MVPMNHVGGAQFVLKPPKKRRGKVGGRARGGLVGPGVGLGVGDVGTGGGAGSERTVEKSAETVHAETGAKARASEGSVEEITTTTTSGGGGVEIQAGGAGASAGWHADVPPEGRETDEHQQPFDSTKHDEPEDPSASSSYSSWSIDDDDNDSPIARPHSHLHHPNLTNARPHIRSLLLPPNTDTGVPRPNHRDEGDPAQGDQYQHQGEQDQGYPVEPDQSGAETNTFAAPPRPSRKDKRYACDVCGQIFTRSGDVRRHQESRHSEGSAGCRCPFCGRVLTRWVFFLVGFFSLYFFWFILGSVYFLTVLSSSFLTTIIAVCCSVYCRSF
jgi:hypothetical protein